MMREVLEALIAARNKGQSIVFTALIETRGSTPQKPGAAMLVYEDGSQFGTLGGGCVEAEVKRKALENLATGKNEVATFHLDHDYGWDDGLICGGRMKLLISPVKDSMDISYYETYLGLIESHGGCTEAVVVEDVAGIPGSRFLFDSHSKLVAAYDSHSPDVTLLANLKPLATRPRPYVQGGVSFNTHFPKVPLFIIGAGHVGKKLAQFASEVDFEVIVVDDREVFCNKDNIPSAHQCVVGDFDSVLPDLQVGPEAFCVIVTRGHNHDEEALFHLIQKSPSYLGMIGSKRKIRLIFEDLIRNGIASDLLDEVRAPIGLKIGSQTVSEIAISIVAELIESRNMATKRKTPAENTQQA